jgi:hypothetical protein
MIVAIVGTCYGVGDFMQDGVAYDFLSVVLDVVPTQSDNARPQLARVACPECVAIPTLSDGSGEFQAPQWRLKLVLVHQVNGQ